MLQYFAIDVRGEKYDGKMHKRDGVCKEILLRTNQTELYNKNIKSRAEPHKTRRSKFYKEVTHNGDLCYGTGSGYDQLPMHPV